MPRIARSLPALLIVLCLSSCKGITDALSTASGKTTYPSIWINASWLGGRTGTPLQSMGVTPNNIIGSYCPANSLTLLNHDANYYAQGMDGGLVVTNNCTVRIFEAAVCRTAGSSGGVSGGLGICAIDPRKTSPQNLVVEVLAPGSRFNYYGNTSIDLNVNLFYCATGSHMNLGEIAGKDATDCIVN